MIKKITVITVSWLLVLLSMLIIFNFSNESSEKSSETSKGVVVQVLDVVMEEEKITPPVIKKYQFPIRKIAHFGIYMLLGFCMYSAFEKSFKVKFWINLSLSFVCCVLYAISDEFHQNFSEGRGPSPTDVLIDSSGALVGILIFIGLQCFYNQIILKKLNRSR